MKIMFIIHSLDKTGGAETILTRLANYFSTSTEHQTLLTIMSNKNIVFDLDHNIITNQYQENNNHHIKIYAQIKEIHKNINTHNPDIIISFVTGINVLSTIAAKLTHTPIIISERSSYAYGVKNKLWSFLRRYTYPLANTLVLPTDTEQSKYHYSKQIDIIPNPLKETYKENAPIEKENIILAVGTLHHVKGFDLLITAFKKANIPNWKLIILGEGSSRSDLEKQISKLNLSDSVIMPGHTKDTGSYYQKASIFALSSRSEGYPNVLCEAMSYGCASIAFDCPTGPKDIITHQHDGILVEAENVSKLSESMQMLVSNKELRKKISTNALNISERLHIKTISKLWEKSINKAIKG